MPFLPCLFSEISLQQRDMGFDKMGNSMQGWKYRTKRKCIFIFVWHGRPIFYRHPVVLLSFISRLLSCDSRLTPIRLNHIHISAMIDYNVYGAEGFNGSHKFEVFWTRTKSKWPDFKQPFIVDLDKGKMKTYQHSILNDRNSYLLNQYMHSTYPWQASRVTHGCPMPSP